MQNISDRFISVYSSAFHLRTVYTKDVPNEMMASPVNQEGWFEWKPIEGTLSEEDYRSIEREFGVRLPKSFVGWHRSYYFLDGDCVLVRLPHSNPCQPLAEIRRELDWFIPKQIVPKKIYPFASDGNDAGSWVFDGRSPVEDNEFPVRLYDHEFGGDLAGLSEVIFSSFPKLLKCITHFLLEIKSRKDFEVIPDFFEIDPDGAGKTGIDYWLAWASMLRADS